MCQIVPDGAQTWQSLMPYTCTGQPVALSNTISDLPPTSDALLGAMWHQQHRAWYNICDNICCYCARKRAAWIGNHSSFPHMRFDMQGGATARGGTRHMSLPRKHNNKINNMHQEYIDNAWRSMNYPWIIHGYPWMILGYSFDICRLSTDNQSISLDYQ